MRKHVARLCVRPGDPRISLLPGDPQPSDRLAVLFAPSQTEWHPKFMANVRALLTEVDKKFGLKPPPTKRHWRVRASQLSPPGEVWLMCSVSSSRGCSMLDVSCQLKSGFSRSRETARSTNDRTFAGACRPSGYKTCIGSGGSSKSLSTICSSPASNAGPI